LESVKIVSRRLVIPEPKQLWTANLKDKRRIIIEAKARWAEFRSKFGFKIPDNVNSLTFGTIPTDNQKYDKSEELIYGLSLAQSNLSGINVCHWSTPECRANCVGKNGNNGFPSIMRAKIAKTRFLFEHPKEAGIMLADFWEKANDKIELGNEVGGRLNTFSDLNWIEIAAWIFTRFPNISYYDYTKDFSRESPFSNYHLTYSASERTTDDEIIDLVSQGKNMAVVFGVWGKKPLPPEYLGFPVIDGDKDDTRWKDPKGVIVGLRRKGTLRADSPMVRKV
jgi:hypothetical protein